MTQPPKPPVFIIGSPRSGTTLLQNLLSRHPSIAICGETRFFADVYRRRFVFGALDNPDNRQRLVDQYLSTARIKRLGLDHAGLRRRLLEQATSYPALLTTIMQYNAEFHGRQRWGEKTPQHSFRTETLSDWYPGAFFIHLVRDPRDVVSSLQGMPWAPKSIWSNSWLWVLFNRAAEQARHNPRYLLVRYEKLVSSPEQELARICHHIGEEWPVELAEPASPSEPYSWPHGVRGPVTRERLQRWRKQLSAGDVALVERIAGKWLENYGYERSGRPACTAALVQAIGDAGLDLVRQSFDQLPHAWFSLTQPTNLPLHEYWKYRNGWEVTFPDQAPLNGRRK